MTDKVKLTIVGKSKRDQRIARLVDMNDVEMKKVGAALTNVAKNNRELQELT